LRVLTRSVNGVPTSTDRGAETISSVGLFASEPTSPNWVETHRSPFWKPSCFSRVLPLQSLARTSRPFTVILVLACSPDSSAFEIWVTPMSAPNTTSAPAAASSRVRRGRGSVALRRLADLRMRDTSAFGKCSEFELTREG
jgi:hypothetical protein